MAAIFGAWERNAWPLAKKHWPTGWLDMRRMAVWPMPSCSPVYPVAADWP